MKQLDPSLEISTAVTNKEFSTRGKIDIIDLHTMLEGGKMMLELMRDAGEDLSPGMLSMLEDPSLFEMQSYVPDPVKYLGRYIDAAIADVNIERIVVKNSRMKTASVELAKKAKGYNELEDYEDLLILLRKYRYNLETSYSDEKAKLNSTLWKLTDEVIMKLSGFNYLISPQNASFTSTYLLTTSRASNMYMREMNRKILKSTSEIRTDFISFTNELKGYIDDVAELYGVDTSRGAKAWLSVSKKKIFENMYVDPEHKDVTTAYTLKDHNDSTLRPAEKRFLKFFQEQSQKYADLSIPSKKDVPEGWMALVPKSKLSNLNDEGMIEGIRKGFSGLGRHFIAKFGEEAEKDTTDQVFSTKNKLEGQFPKLDSDEFSFTAERQNLLQVDQFGDPYNEEDGANLGGFEDNLENVLYSIVLSSLDAYHYRDVSEFTRSVYYTIRRHEDVSNNDLGDLKAVVRQIQETVVNHKTYGEKGDFIDRSNKITTNIAIAGTVTQLFLEAFTNPFITAAKLVEDSLYGLVFKGQREFSAASYARAYAIMHTPGESKDRAKVNAIDAEYGFTNNDTIALAAEKKLLEGSFLFQSKSYMAGTKFIMETWQKITLAAFMIEEGSFDAHYIDAEGNLQYDETKDKRFSTNTGDPDKNLYNKKRYEATKEALAGEYKGLIGKDGDKYEDKKLAKAYTGNDMNYLKEMIVEMYSAMDASAKSLATSQAWLAPVIKMKTWIFSKTARYFQKPLSAEMNRSGARLKEVKNLKAEGEYDLRWQSEPTEGILYTLKNTMIQLHEYKYMAWRDVGKDYKDLEFTEYQKKNFSKLVGDMIVFAFMGAALYGWNALGDDDEPDSPLEAMAKARFEMAQGDVFFLYGLLDTMSSGSMFVPVSIITRQLESMINAVQVGAASAVKEDVSADDLKAALNKMGGASYGPYRTIEAIHDEIIYNMDK